LSLGATNEFLVTQLIMPWAKVPGPRIESIKV